MANEQVVAVGKMLSDHTRVALLDAMFDGRAYTVTELSRHVDVAQSTASEHLGKLLDAELVATESQGRHRYYRLRSPEVASLLEQLFEFGNGTTTVTRSSRVPAALAYARTCYDHLAGTVAVAFTEHLHTRGFVAAGDGAPIITDAGRLRLTAAGVAVPETSGLESIGGRPTVRTCLDWSERKHHLAGAMPAALLELMLDRGWFRRQSGGRALRLTDAGRLGLRDQFGFEAP
ncbi:MAG: metalloregulator ArsR/SmtB family transcription factor [Actinomycetota bacterium]